MVQLNTYRAGGKGWFPFVQDGHRMGDRAILDWVRVGASEPPKMPAAARLDPPSVFGEAIALQGAQTTPEEHGLRVMLWWKALAPPEEDYTVFVHVVDEEERLIGTGDGPPLEGGFPTRLWRPGDSVADEHLIPLPADLPPGVYTIRVGWYDPTTGVRLPAMRQEKRLSQDAAIAGTWSRP
jgi:hypothetical protein